MALKAPAKGCAGRAGRPGADEPFSTYTVINTEWRWLQPSRTSAVKIDGSYERAAKGLAAGASVESDIAGILATCKTKGWVAHLRIHCGGGNAGGVDSTSGAADIAGRVFSNNVVIAAAGAPGWVKDAGLGGKPRMTSWFSTQRQEETGSATLTTSPPIEFTQYEIPCYWTTQFSDAYDYFQGVLAATGTVTGAGFMAGVNQAGLGLDANAQVASIDMTAGGYTFPEPMLHHIGGIEHHNPAGDLTNKGQKATAISWWPTDSDADNHNGREIFRALIDTGWDFASNADALWLAEWASIDGTHPPAFQRFLASHAKFWLNTHTSMSFNPYDTVTRGTYTYPAGGVVGNPAGDNSRAFAIMDYFAGSGGSNAGLLGRAEIMQKSGDGNSYGSGMYTHIAGLGAPVAIQTATYPKCLNGAAGTTDAAKWQNLLTSLVGGGGNGWDTQDPTGPVASTGLFFVAGYLYGDPQGAGGNLNGNDPGGPNDTITLGASTSFTHATPSQDEANQFHDALTAIGGTASTPTLNGAGKWAVTGTLGTGNSLALNLTSMPAILGSDNTHITATGPQVRAFLAGYISGEGNSGTFMVDDDSTTADSNPTAHNAVLIALLGSDQGYNIAADERTGHQLFLTTTSQSVRFHGYPFVTWTRVPGGTNGGWTAPAGTGYRFTRIELPSGYQTADPSPHPITSAADALAKANPLVRTDPGTQPVVGDVLDSLAFRFSMENPGGTTVPDDSGNGLTLQLHNFPNPPPTAASPTGNGQALVFDRPSQRYGVVPTNALLNMTGGYTMTAWMYIAEDDTSQVNWEVMEEYGSKWLNVRSSALGHILRFGMQTAAGAGSATRYQVDSPGAVPRNVWVHVAGVYDPSTTPATQRVYINGAQVASQTSDPTTGAIPRTGAYAGGTNPMVIGAHFSGNGAAPSVSAPLENWMHGPMDEVRLYSRALSSGEIAAVYAATTATTAGANLASYNQSIWLDPTYATDWGTSTNVAATTQVVGASGFTQNALRVATAAAGSMTWQLAPIPVASLVGQHISGSALVREAPSGGVARSATMTYTFRNSSHATVGTPSVSGAVTTSTTAQQLSLTSITVPSTTVDVVVSITFAGAAAAGEAQQLGDIAIRPGDAPAFAQPAGSDPVTNLNTTAASTSVVLTWADPTSAQADHIVIRQASGTTAPTFSTGTLIAGSVALGTKTFTATGLTTNTAYSFSVFAVDANGVPSIPASVTTTTVGQQTQQVGGITLTVTMPGATPVAGTPPTPPPAPFTLVTLQDQITDATGTPVQSAEILVRAVAPDQRSAVYAPGHTSVVQPADIHIGPQDAGLWTAQLPPDATLVPAGSYYTIERQVPGGFRDPTPIRIRIDGTADKVWLDQVIVLPAMPFIHPNGRRFWWQATAPTNAAEGDVWLEEDP